MISIRESYADKQILVTGTSGFLGKVWLVMLLERVPDVSKVYVLLRKKGLRPVTHRFEKLVNTSAAFKPLHRTHGANLSKWLSEKVEVIEGDIAYENFGMDDETAARLRTEVDVVINCAGVVDFAPDVRLSKGANIDGPINVHDFVASCDNASFVHVSTCYVQGRNDGRVKEQIRVGYSPTGAEFDPVQEYAKLENLIAEVEARDGTETFEAELAARVEKVIGDKGLDVNNERVMKTVTRRERSEKIKRAMAQEGTDHADALGWPNSYTYTKSLGEQLLKLRAEKSGVDYCVVRPAIVESAMSFPFPGWNEGFNTSGPVVYLLGTWFRNLPCKRGNPFDVVPVDYVCKVLMIAGAATMRGEQAEVYQAATSGRNTFVVDRAVELTALAHRRHYRSRGSSMMERVVLSRMDSVDSAYDHLFSVPNVRKTARNLASMFDGVKGPSPLRRQARQLAKATRAADKQLKGVQKIVDVFKPFIHDHCWYFESENVKAHNVMEEEFRFEPEGIDWRNYWIEIQVPGLRKWSFPQYEGKSVESFKPAHPVKLQPKATVAAEPVRNIRKAG
jgi:long-chain acyl-CoA synthetase